MGRRAGLWERRAVRSRKQRLDSLPVDHAAPAVRLAVEHGARPTAGQACAGCRLLLLLLLLG